MSPTPDLAQALSDYVAGEANRKRRLSLEIASGVGEDGKAIVRGVALPTTGRVPIHAGEAIAVAWRDDRPDVVMMNEGNRTGIAALLPELGGSAIEELFIATNPATGQLEVWYRNFDQVTPLGMGTRLGGGLDPSTIKAVKWGPTGDRFAVRTEYFTGVSPHLVLHVQFHIFKFARSPQKNFDAGQSAASAVSLEAFQDMDVQTTVVATLSYAGSHPFTLAGPRDETFAPNFGGGCDVGDYFLDDEGHLCVIARMAASGAHNMGIAFFENWFWDVLVDVTAGKVILSVEGGDNTGLHQIEKFNDIGWASPTEPNYPVFQSEYRLVPNLIINGVVKGFISAGLLTTYFGVSPQGFGLSIQGPKKIVPQVIQDIPGGSVLGVIGTTLDHALWAQGTTAKVLDFDSGSSADVGPTQDYVDQDLRPLFTDFLYRPDDQASVLPAGAKSNVFIRAWPFGGGPATVDSAAGFAVDQTMAEAAALKSLPAGVTPDALSLVIRCINDHELLPRFETYPTP